MSKRSRIGIERGIAVRRRQQHDDHLALVDSVPGDLAVTRHEAEGAAGDGIATHHLLDERTQQSSIGIDLRPQRRPPRKREKRRSDQRGHRGVALRHVADGIGDDVPFVVASETFGFAHQRVEQRAASLIIVLDRTDEIEQRLRATMPAATSSGVGAGIPVPAAAAAAP